MYRLRWVHCSSDDPPQANGRQAPPARLPGAGSGGRCRAVRGQVEPLLLQGHRRSLFPLPWRAHRGRGCASPVCGRGPGLRRSLLPCRVESHGLGPAHRLRGAGAAAARVAREGPRQGRPRELHGCRCTGRTFDDVHLLRHPGGCGTEEVQGLHGSGRGLPRGQPHAQPRHDRLHGLRAGVGLVCTQGGHGIAAGLRSRLPLRSPRAR